MSDFSIPVYVTEHWRYFPLGLSHDYDTLGVSLDLDVAISRLTTWMVGQDQALKFTPMDERELRIWGQKHRDEFPEGTWHVSANRRLWMSFRDDIKIARYDALSPLAGELL